MSLGCNKFDLYDLDIDSNTTVLILQIAKITEEGVSISPPYALKTFWKFSAFQNPAKGAEGSW